MANALNLSGKADWKFFQVFLSVHFWVFIGKTYLNPSYWMTPLEKDAAPFQGKVDKNYKTLIPSSIFHLNNSGVGLSCKQQRGSVKFKDVLTKVKENGFSFELGSCPPLLV